MPSKRQLALVHHVKRQIGLDDESYRLVLVASAGVTSAAELDNEGVNAVLGCFEWLGWSPREARGPDYGKRDGMASFAQLELIRQLWTEYTGRRGGEAELTKWLKRTFKVDSARFLTATDARKAIVELKAMKARAAA
jgi:hypothetical protein